MVVFDPLCKKLRQDFLGDRCIIYQALINTPRVTNTSAFGNFMVLNWKLGKAGRCPWKDCSGEALFWKCERGKGEGENSMEEVLVRWWWEMQVECIYW